MSDVSSHRCHNFNFVNMRSLVKVIFSLLNSTERFAVMESLILNLLFLFIFLHIFPGMNKFPFNENDFLCRLIKFYPMYLPKCLFLEKAMFKNPSKEYCQNINYAVN